MENNCQKEERVGCMSRLKDAIIETIKVGDKRALKRFLLLPYSVYDKDPLWVPPLLREMRDMADVRRNPLLRVGPHSFFLALNGHRPVGRLCAGINDKFNEVKAIKDGYVCLFESLPRYEIAESLFHAAFEYLSHLGARTVKGPVSPTNGDEYRGLLVEGFDYSPMLFQSYNPQYYQDYFERYGFVKDVDYFAFRSDLSAVRDRSSAVRYAMAKYGFRTDPIDLQNLEGEMTDIRRVIEESMPPEWVDLVPPSIEELRTTGAKLKGFALPDLVRIARHGDRPVGLSVAMPDYNQALACMNGRLFPWGWLAFLLARRKIDSIRLFIVFVVPDFQKKGVAHSLYFSTLEAARRLGYTWSDASTVADFNWTMRREAKNMGALHYKTYRVYAKPCEGGLG